MSALSDRRGHFGKDYLSCLSISRRHARPRDETKGLFDWPRKANQLPPQSNPVGEKCSSGLTIKSALQHGSLGIKCKTETSEPIWSGTRAAAESFTAFFPHMRDRNAADFLGAP
jgi:hypothetical protein